MGKISSKIVGVLGRAIKVMMVLLVLPFAMGLLQSILSRLEFGAASSGTYRDWVSAGFSTYVGVHLLLYRPVPVFQASHRVFSALAVWLFGGQVASVQEAGGGKGGGKKAKGGGDAKTQGSTLVAFSPYVIPSYAVAICALSWLLSRWVDRRVLDVTGSFLVGSAMAFHWAMTADELQQQRKQWHLETYLLAIGLVFVLTLILAGACLPWAVPEFSFLDALSDSVARTQEIYVTILRRVFGVG